jgi:hypothetical protein
MIFNKKVKDFTKCGANRLRRFAFLTGLIPRGLTPVSSLHAAIEARKTPRIYFTGTNAGSFLTSQKKFTFAKEVKKLQENRAAVLRTSLFVVLQSGGAETGGLKIAWSFADCFWVKDFSNSAKLPGFILRGPMQGVF